MSSDTARPAPPDAPHDALHDDHDEGPDIRALTGVRSGKRSYYRAYVASDQRLERAVRAMDSISRALVRTVEGPRPVLEEVVRAATDHLDGTWTVLAVCDDHLPGARPRFLAGGPDGMATDAADLPAEVRAEVAAVRGGRVTTTRSGSRWSRVPMTLAGDDVGCLAVRHGLDGDPEPGDLSVLRILANQAAVSLHTSQQYQEVVGLHRRAQDLYDAATNRARDLQRRTAELHQAEQRLAAASQRELLATERRRIARELHDSVAQHVLSVGIGLEVARGELDREEVDRATITAVLGRLGAAKDLTGEAVDQLRRAIHSLHTEDRDELSTLPELLDNVAAQHRPQLDVDVRVEGVRVALGAGVEHDLVRIVGEALFNVAVHAEATTAVVRLRYRDDHVRLWIADDGTGDPSGLRRRLQVARRTDDGGHHRGLVNMEARITERGGTLAFRRARLGGVRVDFRLPLPVPA